MIGLIMLPIPAFAYTADPLWNWNSPPDICVWDSDYNWMMTEAVNSWWIALDERFGENGQFNAFIIYGEEPEVEFCDIHLVLHEIEYADMSSEGILGTTWTPDKGTNIIFITVYETGRPGDTLDEYNNSVIRTIQHELGHGFGLNHWIPDNMAEALRPWPTTLMWAYQEADAPAGVDEYTIDQFEHIYGPNGWVGKNDNRSPFTVDYLGVDIFGKDLYK
jgi:hypothetical protein